MPTTKNTSANNEVQQQKPNKMTTQAHKRSVNKKALLRAVQFVREVRENSLRKDGESAAEIVKRIGVNNGYPSALRSIGVLEGKKWNQNSMIDHDIALSLMRICAQRNHKKATKVEAPKPAEAKAEKPAAKPVIEKAKQPKMKAVKATTTQPTTKKYVIRIFGKEVFSREVVQ